MLIFFVFLPHSSHYNLHVYFRGQLVQAPVGLISAARLKKWQHLLLVSPNE